MATEKYVEGVHPPRQARSRAALRTILETAEQVLAAQGLDDFTMVAVAEHAGVSVGALYRRFTGKEQLLNAVKQRVLSRLEGEISVALAAAGGDLASVVRAYVDTMVDGLSRSGQALPAFLGDVGGSRSHELGQAFLVSSQELFLEAVASHLDEVRRSNRTAAARVAARTVIAACIHRAVTLKLLPDGMSWQGWAGQLSAMMISYLASPDTDGSG